jgi:hypothetical protein
MPSTVQGTTGGAVFSNWCITKQHTDNHEPANKAAPQSHDSVKVVRQKKMVMVPQGLEPKITAIRPKFKTQKQMNPCYQNPEPSNMSVATKPTIKGDIMEF